MSTWNRQIKGQTQYELARSILRNTYKIRNSLRDAQRQIHIVTAGSHFEKFVSGDNENRESAQVLRFLFRCDYSELESFWNELEADLIEAEVVWGESINFAFGDLKMCSYEMTSFGQALDRLLDMACKEGINQSLLALSRDYISKTARTITSREFTEQLDSAGVKPENDAKLRRYLGHNQKHKQSSTFRKWAIRIRKRLTI